jgi:hypothetical protein
MLLLRGTGEDAGEARGFLTSSGQSGEQGRGARSGTDLAHESLAAGEVEVERARRGLERLRGAADHDGDAAALLRQDRLEGLAIRGADAQPEPELAEEGDAEVCAEGDLRCHGRFFSGKSRRTAMLG